MKNHHLAAAAAALAAVLSAAPVAACTGTTVLFADDFSIADPAWGNYQGTTFSSGQMTIEAEAGGGYMLLNQFALYQDFDICMDVVQHVSDPSTGWASLIFWGLDYDNFYMLDVAGNGYVRVTRVQNARWLSPVSWTLTEGVVKPGEELRTLRKELISRLTGLKDEATGETAILEVTDTAQSFNGPYHADYE